MKKNLFLSAAAVCVAVAFAACSSKPAEEATEEVAEPVEEVAEEAVEAVDTVAGDTIVAIEGEAAEAAPVAE